MKIAIVVHCDHHADPGIFAFENEADAILYARERARAFDRWGCLDETLTAPMRQDGWLYYGSYGGGDLLHVELVELR